MKRVSPSDSPFFLFFHAEKFLRKEKVYFHNTWSFVHENRDDGINRTSYLFGKAPNLISFHSKLFATWHEGTQIRVKSYNGVFWSVVDGNNEEGINKDSSKEAYNVKQQVHKNQLYSIWYESNGIANQVRVALYDGNSTWTFPGNSGYRGINYNPSQVAEYPILITFNNQLYASWAEYNGVTWQIRIARLDNYP